MSSNIPTLSDIIQSSPARSNVAESPIAPGSRRSSKRFSSQTQGDDTLVVLNTRRDELINKRKQLKALINDIQLQISRFGEGGGEAVATDETLIIPRKRNQNETLDKLRSELNKLPITANWNLRSELLKLFQPHLKIQIKSVQVTKALKEIQFDLYYHKLFKVEMTLKIDVVDEKVLDLITRFHNAPSELVQSVAAFKDVTYVIYAINSYVRLLLNKIDVWLRIFEKYRDRLTINNLDSSNELINFLKLKNEPILLLKTLDRQLNIIWDFQVDEFGEFETVIKCLFIRDDGSLTNYDELITEIIKNDGLHNGICAMIDNALLNM